jgi:hypothetical protein
MNDLKFVGGSGYVCRDNILISQHNEHSVFIEHIEDSESGPRELNFPLLHYIRNVYIGIRMGNENCYIIMHIYFSLRGNCHMN